MSNFKLFTLHRPCLHVQCAANIQCMATISKEDFKNTRIAAFQTHTQNKEADSATLGIGVNISNSTVCYSITVYAPNTIC